MISFTDTVIERATAAPIPDWGPTIIAVSVSLTSVALILVIMRLATRWNLAQLGWDDFCLVVAILFSIGHSANDVVAVSRFGYGKHEYDLPADIRNSGGANLGFWISQLFTKPSLCAVRLSFCVLYLRIFRGISGDKRRFIKICMAIIFAYYLAATIATVLTCVPIERNWNKRIHGKCIDSFVFIYINAGANIIIDFVVVALPLPVIAELQRNRSVIAIGTIALAIPSILVSILRLPTLAPASRAQKPGGDTSLAVTQSTIWTIAELNVPIMACCLVVLAKPIIAILTPVLKRLPFLASNFKTAAYDRNARYGTGRTGGSRFKDSKGWSRTGDETLVTIGGSRSGIGQGFGGKSGNLTSDGASDESILGHVERGRNYGAHGGISGVVGGTDEGDGYELHGYKNGIVKTVAIDVKISGP
ncbi:hypothetical protein N431DRAFT_442983 [Stipitochalara longipes BDJ]|nr:hypothetical protein N431DRAFT_442983 [Stipitochalara longipes BDJ]